MSELTEKPKTMVDVYRLLPEGTPIQVINNKFFMSPAPNFMHFELLDTLIDILKSEVRKQKCGRIIFAPVDLFLGDENAVQPDIMFLSNENLELIKEDGIYGAPDIIIEILSPRNKNADLVKKKKIYEAFGVKEYFIAEPSDKFVISYYLKNKKFSEQKKLKGKLVSEVLGKTFFF